MTPTCRSLTLLRNLGYRAEVVERRLPRCFISVDLFGFIDLLAIRPGEVLGVQVTTRAHQANRMAKALALPALGEWLASGARFEVHGWAKVGARGKRKLWDVTRRAVAEDDQPCDARPIRSNDGAGGTDGR